MISEKMEQLQGGVSLFVSDAHKFGTDAFLLANFAAPRRKERCCDLGSGCGIIPFIWCARAEDKPKQIFAVEIQAEAVALIEKSVAHNGLAGVVIPLRQDLRTPSPLLAPAAYDVLTCNPPYKAANTGIISEAYSDQVARHEVLCTAHDVAEAAKRLLRFGGRLCVCQRPERLCDVMEAMRANGIEPKRLRFVQQRPDSAPWLFLLEGKKGARPFLSVEKPLIIEGPGGFSREVLDIYGKKDNLPKAGC